MWFTAKCYLVQNKANEDEDDKYRAVKVFQRSIMICIFSVIRMFWMFF